MKSELEMIWNYPKIAYPLHIVGWLPANKCKGKKWDNFCSNILMRIKCRWSYRRNKL